ncbi:hypothetical protein QYE76_045200 [Lolium multiflorum]|uniref:Uncharacterized protein n=1 Tax=Lolium multiflorum TaxID=4521 RepID=A0AAD8TMF6_LOLMU|nr:hypothetical protein QYE76_045200 [Lolium multiflorum]
MIPLSGRVPEAISWIPEMGSAAAARKVFRIVALVRGFRHGDFYRRKGRSRGGTGAPHHGRGQVGVAPPYSVAPPWPLFVSPSDFRKLQDDNMSIILGRPFLNTAGAVIDCNKGKVTFNVDDREHTVYFPKRIEKACGVNTISNRGKIRNIQLPAIKYFAYYIGTSILGRENTSNISSYHLGFLIAALTGDTPYHLGALVARRLSNKGPIFGGIIASRILAYLELPLDPNDVKIAPMRLDIAAMKSHQFVTADSRLDNIVYRVLFADGEEREVPLPQPDLFSINRKPWSRSKEEVDEQLKIHNFHQQHDSEDAEPSYCISQRGIKVYEWNKKAKATGQSGVQAGRPVGNRAPQEDQQVRSVARSTGLLTSGSGTTSGRPLGNRAATEHQQDKLQDDAKVLRSPVRSTGLTTGLSGLWSGLTGFVGKNAELASGNGQILKNTINTPSFTLEGCSVELWELIVHGHREPQDPTRLTSTEFYNRQLNASARDKIRSGINRKLLDQVDDIVSAKELWDRIVVLQEGTDLIQSSLYETAKQEAYQFMIRDGESVFDAYARLGALKVRIKGLGAEKYNDGFEMNEAFIKSKVIAMIAVKQEDTNLGLNLQIMTKSADLNSDDLVSYVAANENMAKAGKRLKAMNRVDEASHNHEASHNLALKARADHESKEDYEIEEEEEMTSTSDMATDFAFFAKKYKAKFPMLLNDKKKKRTCYNCDEDSHFANECPYEKRVDKPRFIKGVKPRLKPNPINDRFKKNKGRAFVGAEYLSDDEDEDEEKEAGVAGLAFSKPGSLFTYDYSKDYSTENDVGSSFMARITQEDDSDDSSSSTIVGSCLMARETKVMEPPPSLSSVLDDENENQDELSVLKELYDVRCTLRGKALVKFDFLMDSLKEKDESIEELEYQLDEKERRFNLLRQELKTERCISQGLKQQIETYELDKVKDLETIDRAQSLTQVLHTSKEELEVAHASLTRDLDHLERANKLVKDELKKLGENHDLLQETYMKALESMKDPIVVEKHASSPTSFTNEHAKLVEEHVRLQEELSLHIETNTYLESLVTKYGLDYHPNESSCEHASILEENVRLTKELAKFTTAKNKMGLDDLLSKQRSNNQKYGLGYVPKSHKKNNYKKEKPAQDKNKKVTNNGKASKGKATSGDRTGPNNHYALFVDYYGDVYANYVGPPNGYAYREYSIWGYSSGGPKWVFDSGCTNHMTGGKGVLDQFIEDMNKKSSITFGDNSKGKVLGYGKVAISKDLCLETVMLVEHLGYNLLSIYHLADAGYNSYFTKYYVQVFRSDNLKLVLVGYVENNLYVVDLSKESPSFSTCLMAAKHDEGWLWHRRLGHVNMRNLKQLLKGEHIVGLTGVSFEKDRVCSACVAGKQLKKKHPIKSIVSTSRPLELLHLDLFGPSHYDTLGGSKYGLVIVDDYSRYSWVFLLKTKDETHREFITFAKKAQRMYESEIKAIRTDNGTEFKNYTMQEFVDDEGIKHEFSAPYTPQQNGVVERKNRTIIEMARTMLSEFNSPHNFWGEAISTSTTPTGSSSVPSTTKPHTSSLPNNKGKLGKFETRTIEGIFVGYAENSHAYRYYNRSSGTIEVSCDVAFLEDNGSQVEQVVPCVAGSWSGEPPRGSVPKRGRIDPPRRSSGRVPPQAQQDTDIGSSARGRTKSVATKHKDKQVVHEDDEVVPTMNVGLANRLEWQEWRTVNPYRFKEPTYTRSDKAFWTNTQAALWEGFYDSHEFMKHGNIVSPKAINPDELRLHEATKYRFVVQTLKGLGLFDLVCLKPDDTQDDPIFCPLLVRQFHCTVFFHDDEDRTLTWMTGKTKYSCSYSQFRAAMGCGDDNNPGYKIHSRSRLTKGDISFCYPANPTPGPPTISGMYYSYLVLAKLFRENLISKSGDHSEVRNYHLNLMYYCHPDRVRKIDGCDLIYCELRRAIMDRMTPNYAQYVQRLINYVVPAPRNVRGERVIMDLFRFPIQEATRPDVPSMMPTSERRSKAHHDHEASSSHSRRSQHGAARFFTCMFQMCKNSNDVAHQTLSMTQETRRRQNEFMASRNHPVPPPGPEMEPVVAPQWEMPLLTDEMLQNFDYSVYAHGALPTRMARAPSPTADDAAEDADENAGDDDDDAADDDARDTSSSLGFGHY